MKYYYLGIRVCSFKGEDEKENAAAVKTVLQGIFLFIFETDCLDTKWLVSRNAFELNLVNRIFFPG